MNIEELSKLFVHYVTVVSHYHGKLDPYYFTEGALASVYSDSTLVADRVFEELGRMGLVGCVLAFVARQTGSEEMNASAQVFAGRIEALVATHSVSGSPCFDNQAVDVLLALMALVGGGKVDVAKRWLWTLVDRLAFAKRLGRYAPIDSNSFDDLVAIRHFGVENLDEFSKVSTLVPVLGMCCVLLQEEKTYELLIQKVVPVYAATTFNMWSPDNDYEFALADQEKLVSSGYGEAFREMPPTLDGFRALLDTPLKAASAMQEFDFYNKGMHWIALMSARHWHLQIPRILTKEIAGVLGAPFARPVGEKESAMPEHAATTPRQAPAPRADKRAKTRRITRRTEAKPKAPPSRARTRASR